MRSTDYKLPESIGVVTQQNHVENQFRHQKYNPGNTMMIKCLTGVNFVDAKNSWMSFTLNTKTATGTTPTTGQLITNSGSILNIFRNVNVYDSTGKELSRCDNKNLLQKLIDQWTRSRDWFDTTGKMLQYPNTQYAVSLPLPYVTATTVTHTFNSTTTSLDGYSGSNTTRSIIVPMSMISPIFDQDKLLPPQLINQLRIEIVLEQVQKAFRAVVQTPATDHATYEIANPIIHWNCLELDTKLAQSIMSQPISLIHREFHHHQLDATSSANYTINKSVSKATRSITMTRETANINSAILDSIGSEPMIFASVQASLGSNRYPPTPQTNMITGMYVSNLYAFDMLRSGNTPSVDPRDFTTTGANGVIETTKCPVVWALRFNKAGVTVNFTRELIYDIRFTNSTARRVDTWLEHKRAITIDGSNVSVKD